MFSVIKLKIGLSYSIIFETACDLGGTGLLLLVNCFQLFKK